MSFLLFCFLSFFVCFCSLSSSSCVVPTGLGTGIGELDPNNINLPDAKEGKYFVTDIALLNFGSSSEYETPIAVRITTYTNICRYNVLAAYDNKAIDIWGRKEISNNRRICLDSNNNNLFKIHRHIAYGYASLFLQIRSNIIPELNDKLNNYFDNIGLPHNICEKDNYNCNDISTPWGLASIMVNELLEWSKYDGWNEFGNYNRNFNKIPYEDWRDNPYIPSNDPWKLKKQNKWQPLQENNGKGFLYNQEHVTPHIGFTGKTLLLTDEEICNLEVSPPMYDYEKEIDILVNRLSKELKFDKKKMEIEYFDGKFTSIGDLAFKMGLLNNMNLDSLDFHIGYLAWHISIYEATLTVWKEKIRHNSIRPTSIIRKLRKNNIINTYAGTDLNGNTQGIQNIKGKDFQPYIRTMPHAEYPSGSACICKAYEDSMIEFYGYDDFNDILTHLPSEDRILTQLYEPFSSKVEPLTTPKNNILLTYNSWSNIRDRCSQSRLDGGMHFTKSIPAGEYLCSGIGTKVMKRMLNLKNGIIPVHVPDFSTHLFQDRCANL